MTNQEQEQIRQRNILWQLAVESSIQSKEDPVMVYSRLIYDYENKKKTISSNQV